MSMYPDDKRFEAFEELFGVKKTNHRNGASPTLTRVTGI